MYNSVTLIGNLTRDTELTETSNGLQVCRFGLAVSRRKKDKTDFFDIVSFGKTADICSKYLNKGKKCLVTGEINLDEYTRKDGTKAVKTNILASDVVFLSAKEDKAEAKPKQVTLNYEGDDDDIPF